ncbi:DEKNAAC101243 [Brettanomyces naardenensis]|uniref:DEKNAAC101243 n=1 Tax=Brettanomyces naardenensis TaxID=13370 RepID=A0A448YHU2_BRENA|nr:DEKNAAC101243 [Brettanomyces naardenensis]
MTGEKRKLVPLLPSTLLKKPKIDADETFPAIKADKAEKSSSKTSYKSSQPRVTTTVINKNPPSYIDQPKPRHLKSCSRCRKHKTKCNYMDTAPNPCSSCAKRGVTCQLEIVIPVKRSNIIKNLSEDVDQLKLMVNQLLTRDKVLKSLCSEQELRVEGLVDVENEFKLIKRGDGDTSPDEKPYNSDRFSGVLTPPDSMDSSNSTEFGEEKEGVKGDSLQEAEDSSDNQLTPPGEKDDCKEQMFKLKGVCSYSYQEVKEYFNTFNNKMLPYVPIMSKLASPASVYGANELLFWTVVYVTSANAAIEAGFLTGELTRRCWAETPRDISIIQSIVILASFPIKTVEGMKAQSELDSRLFQQLQFAKDLSSQIGLERCPKFAGEFSRRVKISSLQDEYRYNIWCLLFVLGNLYGFKLGLKWDFRVDYILESRRKLDSYMGRLLNVVILLSDVLNTLVYSFAGPSAEDQLPKKSLTLWTLELEKLKAFETDSNVAILISLIDIVLNLFAPTSTPRQKRTANVKILESCRVTYTLLANMEIARAPMFVKLSLEFISLVTSKLVLSPYNGGNPDTKLFIQVFNKLAGMSDYNDTKPIVDALMDLDSSFKIDSSVIAFEDFSSFKVQLMQGILFDIKHIGREMKIGRGDFKRLHDYFEENSLDLAKYKKSIAHFRNQVDMISLYSDVLLNMDGWDNGKESSESYDPVDELCDINVEKMSDARFASILNSMEII